jgi:MFS transporter, ACS family, tartrate transporter
LTRRLRRPYKAAMSQALTTEDLAHRATMRKITRRLLPFLILIYVVAWLDRVNVGFAALQMNRDLGFSPAVYGFGAGIFFLSYAAFEVPSNLILSRVGARRWIARIMVTWGLIAAAMALVRGPASFYALRFLLGAAEAGCFPGIVYFLGAWYPQSERGKALGLFAVSIPLSAIVGGPIAGMIFTLNGSWGLSGWQWLFAVEGLGAVLLGSLVFLYLPDSPAHARWLDEGASTALIARLERERMRMNASSATSVRAALLNPLVWTLGISYALGTTTSYGLQFWIPQIIKVITQQSDLTVSVLSAMPYVATPFAMVFVSILSDRSRERCLHAAVSCFIGAAGIVAAAFAHSAGLAIFALTISLAGLYGRFGPFWALPTVLFRGSAAAAAIALINTIGSVGGFLGPYGVGLAKATTGNYRGALLFLAVTAFVSGMLLVSIRTAPAVRRWV